jgi:hypothetical protein
MMSEVVRYEIKNFITWTLDFENWHKKNPGWVRTQRTHGDQLILVDPVEEDVEEIRPRTDPPNFWRYDLNKRKIITHPIVIVFDHHFTLHWLLAIELIIIQIFLMWSQINLLLSIRLTGGRQTGFKVFKPLL